MTAIERTAYPRLPYHLNNHELNDLYGLSASEQNFVTTEARKRDNQLVLAVLLKTFQNLAYFPNVDDIPSNIIAWIADPLGSPGEQLTDISNTTLYRYHQLIRDYLNVRSYGEGGTDVAEAAIVSAAQTMNDPADLINAAIEELVHQRFALPGFSQLDRLTARIRTQINEDWYQSIFKRLSPEEKLILENLPLMHDEATRTDFTLIKQPPKKPSLNEVRRVHRRLLWLTELMDTKTLLEPIPTARIRLFAGEARALEAGDIVRFSPPRRYTLLLCLLHEATIKTRDTLATLLIRHVRSMHNGAKRSLDELREQERQLRETMVEWMGDIVGFALHAQNNDELGERVQSLLVKVGDLQILYERIQAMKRYHGNNLLPLMPKHYASRRTLLFAIIEALDIHSATQDTRLVDALAFIRRHRQRRVSHLPAELDIDFVSQAWRKLILDKDEPDDRFDRRLLEIAIFSYVATELQTSDLYIEDSEEYGDLRHNLLRPEEYRPLIPAYCAQLGFPDTADSFVQHLRAWLEDKAYQVDNLLVDELEIYFDNGRPVLRRLRKQPKPEGLDLLSKELKGRMPEQNLLDILAYTDKLVGFTRHFGPLSGSDPKLTNAVYRYLMTIFAHGCNLGPSQTARHSTGLTQFSAMDLSRTNSQHVTASKLDAALRDVINFYKRFDLPYYWGSGKAAAADGTLIDIYNNNLLSAYHIRYGKYGGVAYHHVSDTYIALFSHFISVGVWEAVYILDGLLQNDSDIEPEMLHADTQGQSLTVFGFAYFLGIQLMPRIRNWKDMTMFRPTPQMRYKNIDALFTKTMDWQLIETHWEDMLQVILSIQAGRVLPSTLLRKLNHRSRKNRLYWAFRELGNVVRTVFLLQYISDNAKRRQITMTTNKSENYNEFSAWASFGGDILPVNDPIEQEKRIKYTDLVANCLILKNVIDMTQQLRHLQLEGYPVNAETIARLSPYQTEHIRRFGQYTIKPEQIVIEPFDMEILLTEDLPDGEES